MSNMIKNKRNSIFNSDKFAVRIILGAVTGLLVQFAFLMLAAICTVSGVLPESAMNAVTIVTAGLSALIGSRVTVRSLTERRAILSGCSALALYAFVFSVGKAVSGNAGVDGVTIALLPSVLVGGLLGAVRRRAAAKRTVRRRK